MKYATTDTPVLVSERRLELRDILNRNLAISLLTFSFALFIGFGLVQRYVMTGYRNLMDAIMGAIIVLGGLPLYIPLMRDVINRRVMSIEAKAHILLTREARRGVTAEWSLVLGKRDIIFEVDGDVAEKIKDGRRYHIEYLPFSRTILEVFEVQDL